MKKQRIVLLGLALAASLSLAGCGKEARTAGGSGAPTSEAHSQSTEEPEKETPETTEASETTAEKQEEESGEAAILAVSFGTSYNDSREKTIGAIEEAIRAACPEYEVRRAFTAQIIIDKLKERDGLEIDNVTEALDRAVADGVKILAVQPTHLMNGLEYQDLIAELEEYQEDFEKIVVGEPLLTSDEDFRQVAKAIAEATDSYNDGETAIVFMGHGTEAESNQVYEKMQKTLEAEGFENYFIGTVEAKPDLEDVKSALKEAGIYKKVVLAPLMVVAGDHANNDMAGDEEDSWKTVFAGEGYEVECLLQGIGELEDIQKIYVEHVKTALEGLD